MLFKAREGNGTWTFGQKQTVPEEGSRWAVNPTIVQARLYLLGRRQQSLGEQLAAVSQPMPDVTELPDKGFAWQEQWAVNMKCLGGTDAGTEVVYKTDDRRRHPGRPGLIEAMRDRLNGGQHDGKVVADRAAGKGLLPQTQYGQQLDPAADDHRLDAAGRSGAPASDRAPPPTSARRAAASPARRLTPMRT